MYFATVKNIIRGVCVCVCVLENKSMKLCFVENVDPSSQSVRVRRHKCNHSTVSGSHALHHFRIIFVCVCVLLL
jgi:hypothetical protein